MAPETGEPTLRLKAEDEEDLSVISACLQDALVFVGDLAYLPQERSFMMVANRFRWEGGAGASHFGHERTLSAVHFGEVEAVSYRGFRKGDNERILSLLAVRSEAGSPHPAILLEFSASAVVRLEVSRIECRVKDLGDPWPTPWRPDHAIGEGA